MANSFAQTLAGGTQDLAALAGLFCTDGVERNALSVQSGYFGIAASSLSLLGILGLVRSAIKVALGLRRCSNAGFNLDSLRGLYGYLLEESEEQKNRIECDYTEVAFGKTKSVKNGKVAIDTHIGNDKYDHVVIRRKKRFFDPQLTPIVNVGSDWPEKLYSKTVVNLGNLQREKSVSQSPILIGLLLFLCPGMTAWLLLVVSTTWNGVLLFATLGLLEAAIPDDPPLSPEKGLKFLILLDIDFDRIVRRRRGRLEPENIYGNFWRLGLEMLEDQTIRPFILIEMQYLASETNASTGYKQE
ncbi:trichothecene efflux pump [Pyrenophora tritici-repentis]|nr:trichothecene efflux pump [Pyrenophora tritici-repentis]